MMVRTQQNIQLEKERSTLN